MKERKRRPDLLRRLGTVSLALLVTFSSVNHSVFAEDEENDTEETQEITEQPVLEETADPEEAIEPEVTETAELLGMNRRPLYRRLTKFGLDPDQYRHK